MPTEGLVIDSTAEDAANVELDLLAYPFAVTAMRFPTPPLQPRWATPDDADGDALVASRYQNREIVISLEIVPTDATSAARSATAQTALAQLADKVAKVNREQGTLRRTLPTGDVQTFDLLTADQLDPSWDAEWETARTLRLDLKFTARPFWRGVEESGTVDGFDANTIADYTVSGTGASISGGRIVVSSTTTKTWLHTARSFIDSTVTLKLTTGASVAAWTHHTIVKGFDPSNYLAWQMTNTGSIFVVKVVAGVQSLVGSGTVAPNLSAGTSYWMRAIMNGNALTAELWPADPSLGGRPSFSVVFQLTGSDATTYGAGVPGYAGFRLGPGGTDWTYDDFSALWMVKEQQLPALTITTPGADGDVPALGRLVVTECEGVDQQKLVWGLQSQSYSSAATAALFYEAEALTPMGTAAVAGDTSASGPTGANVVAETNVTPTWAAVLSTQAAGGGAHLTHVGTYRVFARIRCPYRNGYPINIALEWATGDFVAYTRNPTVTYPFQAIPEFVDLDLGVIAVTGAERWEGRIIASCSMPGNTVAVDCIWLVPIERSGEFAIVDRVTTATAFVARDEFAQTAGALTGKALTVGGTWVGAGDADDFTVTGSGSAQRTATADALSGAEVNGRLMTAGTPVLGRCMVRVDVSTSSLAGAMQGVLARYVDSTHFMAVGVQFFPGNTGTAPGSATIGVSLNGAGGGDIADLWLPIAPGTNTSYTLQALVETSGRVVVWFAEAGASLGSPVIVCHDAALATGGALDDGKVGLFDWYTGSGAATRTFDNFVVWVPPADAAVFAGRSAEIRHDGVRRQDSAGTIWGPVSSEVGDRLFVPPAGPERRAVRTVVKGTRTREFDIDVDAISAQLFMTKRGLAVT